MWMVSFNGAWQPADTDTIVTTWIQTGRVGPTTPIRHSSWPEPRPLSEVPEFAHACAGYSTPVVMAAPRLALQPSSSSPANDKLIRVGAWALGMLVVFVLLVSVGSRAWTPGILTMLLGLVAIGALVAGKFVATAPPFVKKVSAALAKSLTLTIAWSSVLILGGFLGFNSHRKTVNDCSRHIADSTSLVGSKQLPYDEAMAELNAIKSRMQEGRQVCAAANNPSAVAGLEAGEAEVDKQLASAQRVFAAAVAEAKLKAAKEAADLKDKTAVEGFPARSREVKARIAEATTKAGQGKWQESASALSNAQSLLAEYKGTSVFMSDPWLALGNQIEAQQKRIQPQLDRLARQEEAQRAKDAEAELKQRAIELLRGPRPVISAWDGACNPCERYLKRALNDPDSYQHVQSGVPEIEGDYWTVVMTFRGKNAFGVLVSNTKKFYFQQGEVVKVGDVD